MSYWKKEPVLILETKEQTAQALQDTSWYTNKEPWNAKWRVKSLWLISLIDEIEATGEYPYNITIIALASERLGLPKPKDREDCGTPLSALVYNAQGYRHHDQFIREGFSPFSPEMIEEAFRLNAKIQLRGGMFLTVREVNGKRYAFKPRKRKFATFPDYETPAKIVA